MTGVPHHLVSDAVSQREMREGRKPIGYGVIDDPHDFYDGREVVVWSREFIPARSIHILKVSRPNSNSGRIEWLIHEDRLRDWVKVA